MRLCGPRRRRGAATSVAAVEGSTRRVCRAGGIAEADVEAFRQHLRAFAIVAQQRQQAVQLLIRPFVQWGVQERFGPHASMLGKPWIHKQVADDVVERQNVAPA